MKAISDTIIRKDRLPIHRYPPKSNVSSCLQLSCVENVIDIAAYTDTQGFSTTDASSNHYSHTASNRVLDLPIGPSSLAF